MKKSKLVGLLAIALTFGMVACGGGGGNDEPKECSHEYEEYAGDAEHVVKAPTCTEKGLSFQKCKLCNDIKEVTVRANGHKYADIEGGVAATCEEAGTKLQKCSVCQDQKTVTVDALGHNMVADTSKTNIPATCEEAGTNYLKCSRCTHTEEETVRALGHTYTKGEDGEDAVTWTTPATCEAGGVGTKHCETCKQNLPYTVDALGHKMETTDSGDTTAGKAKVRLYNCTNGCGITYFGFKATEVSEASKPHLVFNEGGGARFFGRPIGNDVPLDEDGAADRDNHDPVFNKQQTGDFFEYVFDLTQEQVDKLGKYSRLYCEAEAAGYLRNKDFWACDGSGEEWTPGLYIDDDPEHLEPVYGEDGTTVIGTQGKKITDYRYVLYFNDQLQKFDSKITNPVKQADEGVKKEYVLPFTFELKAGTNKISLRMSGGYRSVFYNFTFRPCDPEAEERFNPTGEKIADAQPVANKYVTSGAYELAAADCEGIKTPVATDKNTRLGKGSMTDTWDITGLPSGMYDVYIKAAYSSGNGGSYYSGAQNVAAKGDGEKSPNNGTPYNPGARYTINVDGGADFDLASELTYAESGLSQADSGSWTKVSLASVGIPNGAKSFVLKNNNNGYSIWIYSVRLIRTGKYVAPPINVTFTGDKARVECENYTDCTMEKAPIVEEALTYVDASPVGSSYSATVPTFTYTLNFAEAKHVKIVFRYKYTTVTASGSTAKYVGQIKLDGTSIYSATGESQDMGIADLTENVPSGEWRTEDTVEFDVTAGQHTLTIKGPGRSAVAAYDYIEFVVVTPAA